LALIFSLSNEPELGAGLDSGMALASFPPSILHKVL